MKNNEIIITEKAYAKLNISLDVGEKRPDGFHDMTMIMQTVSLCDDVTVAVSEGTGKISCTMNVPYIATDLRNLAVKAAALYLNELGKADKDINIKIKKNIPTGAGMAGGSADAAAVLRALNGYFEKPFDEDKMLELSGKVGSDVPFCYIGGTCLAKGRGELLTPISPFPDAVFVIAKPRFSISTPEFFAKLDNVPTKNRLHPNSAEIVKSIQGGDLQGICRRMYNVFESVDDRRLKVVSELKSIIMDSGALGSIMTGTGSAVFGIFDNMDKANKAKELLSGQYGFVCTATPIN